jgi:hypothetical protein
MIRSRRLLALAAAMVAAGTISGCAALRPDLSQDVAGIRSGVTAARQQANDSFAAANELVRDQAIERKVRLPETILRVQDFPVTVSPEAARQWDNAFDILDQYGAALESLVDEQRSRATGDSIGALGQALNSSAVLQAKIPASLVSVFATFGQALVQASAERKAVEVMRATDPAFHRVVGGMAAAIGTPAEAGSLANDVQSQWENSMLPQLENDYAAVPPADMDHRRKILEAYTQAMADRDKQLDNLQQLQRSLVALGEAHSAAARGKPGDALFWIGRINAWADDVRNRLQAAKEKSK